MNIVNLKVENFKRISAIDITPGDDLVIIGGMNGAGKSSVLDSIESAIAGKNATPDMPLKKGESKGHIIVDLGDIIITRKFHLTKDGEIATTIEVTNKEGFKKSSPQALLDSLYGKMTFDPLEFSRLKPKDQLEQLKNLVGLDFSELDRNKDGIYNKRTLINKEFRSKQAQIGAMDSVNAETPDEEVSISNLMAALNIAQEKNFENRNLRNFYEKSVHEFELKYNQISEVKNQINELTQKLNLLSKELDQKKINADTMRKSIDCLINIDTIEISEKIKNAESINSEVRKKKDMAKLQIESKLLESEYDNLTFEIETIEDIKKTSMSAANFPIIGMGFDENGVTMHGIPFQQASSAEKLRVSVAMGIALNPKLKIMQIRDGSLLDKTSMALIREMAKSSKTQIWVEMVGENEDCSVIISEGFIKGDENFL